MYLSALVTVHPKSELSGEFLACGGVDVQAARPAPVGKGFEINIRLDYDVAFTAEALEAAFSFAKPLAESLRQTVAVNE